VALALFAGLEGAAMLLVSVPVVLLSSLGIMRLANNSRLGGMRPSASSPRWGWRWG